MSRNVRDEGVAGSNPATPTSFLAQQTAAGNDMGDETVAQRASALLL